MLAVRALAGGIKFSEDKTYDGKNFDKTVIGNWLENDFAREMVVLRGRQNVLDLQLTLLKEDQVWGDNALGITMKYGKMR